MLDPLHQLHPVPAIILAIVAGITGEHGQRVLNQGVKWMEQDSEPEHMCKIYNI